MYLEQPINVTFNSKYCFQVTFRGLLIPKNVEIFAELTKKVDSVLKQKIWDDNGTSSSIKVAVLYISLVFLFEY